VRYDDLPLTGSTALVSQITGLPPTTIRRLTKVDREFPQPFVINDRGDLRWVISEVLRWLEARAGRALLAA
jgi:predicted DNA-binding transcriptional regulator AlpA